jgi:hypothetical protein
MQGMGQRSEEFKIFVEKPEGRKVTLNAQTYVEGIYHISYFHQ